jgi:hypothetical protein
MRNKLYSTNEYDTRDFRTMSEPGIVTSATMKNLDQFEPQKTSFKKDPEKVISQTTSRKS